MLQESSKIVAKDTDKKRSRYFLENFQLHSIDLLERIKIELKVHCQLYKYLYLFETRNKL